MTAVNVLVVFYSRYGETERLALAAGLGAVQGHANIRLRRLKDLVNAKFIERDALWAENFQRMALDYIAPREIDAAWADVILVASCLDSPGETEEYLKALMAGDDWKDGTRIIPLMDDAADRLGSALAQGRQAVEMAREQKA